jgi:GT2 family glycosyltransferase
MRLENFICDSSGVYRAKEEGTPAGYMDGAESYLLELLGKSRDLGLFSSELKSGIRDWPSLYHLSPYRSTIFECLDFHNKDAKVLELGSGCGAVTRWLGEHFKEVCAVEGGFHRAQVAHMRCRDLDSVDVHAANFLDLKLLDMFNIATLIGVLEYSHMYHPELRNSPFRAALSTLELVYEALKEKGALVLAIENKFGLKYFSGAKEDHSGRVFDGIQGYPRLDSAVTFSAAEIEDLLRKAGFSTVQCFLPFPDYKLASTIINFDEISAGNYLHNWIETPFKDRCSGQRSLLFNESLVARELIKGRMLKELSNSFLVVAYKGDKDEVIRHLGMSKLSWVAKHYSLDRHPTYCKKVTLKKNSDESLVIENSHVVTGQREDGNASDVFTQNLAEEIFHRGDQLLFTVFEIIAQTDADPKFLQLIESLIQFLMENYSSGKEDIIGVPLLKGEAYDITFWNIIVEEGTDKWRVIDREWTFNGLIPVDFVVWRNLFHLILRFNSYFPQPFDQMTAKKFTIQCIRNYYPAFDEDRYDAAHAMDDCFQHYVGHGNLPCAIDQLPLCRPFEQHYKGQCELLSDSTGNENKYDSELRKKSALVSIIIPVFNQLDFTIQCLEALASNTCYEPYEVIIIDNASTDGTAEFLQQSLSGNVKVITNKENLGFSKANNQGARSAGGEYLIFLNNDTVPQPGWLENLVDMADTMPDAGIIGSKLLYPDNTIQHAGVVFDIVENDLFIWHIYRNFEKDHPAVNSVREFNAVTAACILVKKKIFFKIGMFDEIFLNGYEDVDLCFKAREKGYRVFYNPQSILYHYETSTERPLDHDDISRKNAEGLITKWKGKIVSDARVKSAEDGFRIKTNTNNEIEYCPLESASKISSLLVEAIKLAEESNYYEALQIYRKILHMSPFNEEALLLAGESSSKTGDLKGAAGYIRAYLQLHPADLKELCSYSELCYELGEVDEARRNVEKVLIFDPHNKMALGLRDKLLMKNETEAVS